jgi:hypothetical protein
MQLMDRALAETQLAVEPARVLQEFFGTTATFLVNRAC